MQAARPCWRSSPSSRRPTLSCGAGSRTWRGGALLGASLWGCRATSLLPSGLDQRVQSLERTDITSGSRRSKESAFLIPWPISASAQAEMIVGLGDCGAVGSVLWHKEPPGGAAMSGVHPKAGRRYSYHSAPFRRLSTPSDAGERLRGDVP